MSHETPTVFVVDDDPAMRGSLRAMLGAAGLATETYASGQEYIAAFDPERPGCLVLDLRLPGESGIDLLAHLQTLSAAPPAIMLTGHGTVGSSVEALKRGALDFLEKPAHPGTLLKRIREAFEIDRQRRMRRARRHSIRRRVASLSSRECDVARCLVEGKRSKEIAGELGISVRTVESHRTRLLQKMRVTSAAELVGLLLRSDVQPGW